MPGASTNNLRKNGAFMRGAPSANPHGAPPVNHKRRRIASDWLIDFYTARPARLKKMLMRLVHEAESGKNIRYMEIVLNLLEGPAKEAGDVNFNFNFLSDSERQRAQGSIDRINAMRKAITLLPEEKSETTDVQSTASSGEGNAAGPDAGNNPSGEN